MKLGPLEIGIIIVIIVIIFAVTRMMRIGKNTAEQDKAPVVRRRTAANNARAKSIRRSRFQILGSILVLVGVLVLLSNISLARWVALAPIWAIIIAVIGLVTIFVARRRP